MNLESLFPHLADTVLHATLILGIALLVHAMWRGLSAARHHAILLGAAAGIPLLFVLPAVMPSIRVPGTQPLHRDAVVHHRESQSEIFIGAPVTIPEGEAADAIGEPEHGIPGAAGSGRFPIAGALIGLWIAGVAIALAKLAMGIVALWRIGRSRGAGSRRRLARAFHRLRAGRRSRLILLAPGSMPMTWGILRHTIALPEDAESWPKERIDRVLRHELAHVARRDCLTTWLAGACFALLWFHPFAWIAKRALAYRRECACDDRAAEADTTPDAYARDLVEIVSSHHATSRAISMGRPSGLARRVQSLTDRHRDRRPLSPGGVFACLPAWLALVCGISMLAACREDGTSGGKDISEVDVTTHTYRLPPNLSGLFDIGYAEIDPFSDDATAERTVNHEEGEKKLADALKKLGVDLDGPPVAVLHTEPGNGDLCRLTISTTEEEHEKLRKIMGNSSATVNLTTHVVETMDPGGIWNLLPNEAAATFGTTSSNQQGMIDTTTRDSILEKAKALEKTDVRSFRISVLSSQRAKFEDAQEFIYPTEYDPPEIPNQIKVPPPSDPDQEQDGHTAASIAVAPANPTAFETRLLGLACEFDPFIDSDNRIELNIDVSNTTFLGYVNYGSPIQTQGVVLTKNEILMPVFHCARESAGVTMPSGSVFVLGALPAPTKQEVVLDASKWPLKDRPDREHGHLFFFIEATLDTR